jgi:DNA-binding GntR family transcriptional regulator
MSTVEQIQQSVMQGIMRGEMQPGTWLRQDEMADRLGVSKIPVREALHRLAANGLLRFESNRGVVVPQLSAPEAEENYGLRRAIELELLRQAIPRMTIVDLARAEVALSDSTMSPTEGNWAFHKALYRASGWAHGVSIAETLHVAVSPYVLLYTEGLDGASDSEAEHHALLEACRESDIETACDLLVTHLDRAATALLDFFAHRPKQ